MTLKMESQQTIVAMAQRGISIRQISKTLGISRKAIRRVLRGQLKGPKKREDALELDLETIRSLFNDCKGNVTRVREEMHHQHKQTIAYSTLTKAVREMGLRPSPVRVGSYDFGPGEEMEHDTSPHRVEIGGKTVTAQCAALLFSYSRMVFAQYYPRFTRFEAKNFLHQALDFMSGACSRCIIDNTCVVLAGGSGADAVISAEMETFARLHGFQFFAHSIGNPNRKPGVERTFHTLENNFLAGRTFSDWADLNRKANGWCQSFNSKEKRRLGMSPQAAWIIEKPYLQPFPEYPIPLYQSCARVVDSRGYVNLDLNRYSVPDRLLGKKVEVHKHMGKVLIYHQGREVASHPRFLEEGRHKSTKPGHHTPLVRAREKGACEQERLLRDVHPDLDTYITEFKRRVRGRGISKFQRLLEIKRTYPPEAFLSAVSEALHYCLFDLDRLESMVLRRVVGDFFHFDNGGLESCDPRSVD